MRSVPFANVSRTPLVLAGDATDTARTQSSSARRGTVTVSHPPLGTTLRHAGKTASASLQDSVDSSMVANSHRSVAASETPTPSATSLASSFAPFSGSSTGPGWSAFTPSHSRSTCASRCPSVPVAPMRPFANSSSRLFRFARVSSGDTA